MTDFSQTKFHCSSLYHLLVSNKKKNSMQLYREAVAEKEYKEQMYEKLKKKDGKMGAKYLEQLDELDILIPKLEVMKDAEEPLSDGCKSFLSTVYAIVKYNKWSVSKDIGSRETQKGKEVEPISIDLVNELDNIRLKVNDTRVENEWFSGFIDAYEGENIIQATKIHDVKSPWDIETFLYNVTRVLPPAYYWQMQGYMDLTGAPVAEVHFCLVNTPLRFVEDTAKSLLRSGNYISEQSPEYKLAEYEMMKNMTFDDIPKNERRIKFIVERNDADIELAHKRVEKCREYLAELEKLHLNFDFTVSSRTFDSTVPYNALNGVNNE